MAGRDLQAKQFRQVMMKVIGLMEDAQPHDASQFKDSKFWRVDIGEYRIVYLFDADAVRVYLIGKRNDDEVYRKLERM